MHEIGRTQLGQHERFLGDVVRAVAGGGLAVPLTEVQELELASELLEVTNEQELERFLGDVFRTVGNAVGQFVRSDTGKALGGILKDAAGKALPTIGQAIGQQFGGSTGAEWGGRIGQAAGSLLGLELEGLSHQEQELEAARQFVRFAGAATNQALNAPQSLSPETVAQAAATAAAHRFAPGVAHELGWRGPYGYPGRPGYGSRQRFPGGYGRFGPGNGRSGYGYGRSGYGYGRSGYGYGSRRYGPAGRVGFRPWMPYGERRYGWAGRTVRPYGAPAGLGPRPPQFGAWPAWRRAWYSRASGAPWTAYRPEWPAPPAIAPAPSVDGAPPPVVGPPPEPAAPGGAGWLGPWGVRLGGLPPWLVQLLQALQSIGFDPAAMTQAGAQPFVSDPGAVAAGPQPPGADQSPSATFGSVGATAQNGAATGTNGAPPGQ